MKKGLKSAIAGGVLAASSGVQADSLDKKVESEFSEHMRDLSSQVSYGLKQTDNISTGYNHQLDDTQYVGVSFSMPFGSKDSSGKLSFNIANQAQGVDYSAPLAHFGQDGVGKADYMKKEFWSEMSTPAKVGTVVLGLGAAYGIYDATQSDDSNNTTTTNNNTDNTDDNTDDNTGGGEDCPPGTNPLPSGGCD